MPPQSKLLFGTAGVPQSASKKSTVHGIKEIKRLGLDCLEVEFVQGVKMGVDTAEAVQMEAESQDLALSVHAPYYVSLNSPRPGIRMVSHKRLLRSARIARICGAQSVVFHPGYYGTNTPEQTFETIQDGLKEVVSILRSQGNPVSLRPETMGKRSQFGSLEEILFLCQKVEGLKPCIDFSHLHARSGKANDYLSFYRTLKKIKLKLGPQALHDMHIHVSGILYGDKGEIKHLMLDESDFRYDEWIQALKDFDVKGMVIIESPTQEKDALMLKNLYHSTS
ncbi:MAG: TIM barrel protein [Candidatus Aminicenantes bacterium]|nr:TIM barrel protein [Candidatus Aminicenantes bacterium]